MSNLSSVASLRRWLYLGPARRVARGLGIGKIRIFISSLQTAAYRLKYSFAPAGTAVAEAGGIRAEFRVSTSIEFVKYRSLGGEKHFLSELLRLAQPGDVIYDIGANVGVFTVFFAKRIGSAGKLLAFEPEDKAYRRLLQNIQANGLSNVETFQLALGNESGSVTLYADSDAASGVHSAVRAPGDRLESTAQTITVVPGDEFGELYRAPAPNMIKLDVEGMEYEVLQGLAKSLASPACRVVVCEVHFSILESRGQPGTSRPPSSVFSKGPASRLNGTTHRT